MGWYCVRLYVDKRKDRTLTTASEGCNFNIESFDDIAMKYWHEFYKGISRANFVIANIPTMTGVLDEATINNYVAQGKFFRAYGYFWLVKEFGGVPYISEPYTSTEGMYKERLSAEEIIRKLKPTCWILSTGMHCRIKRSMKMAVMLPEQWRRLCWHKFIYNGLVHR